MATDLDLVTHFPRPPAVTCGLATEKHDGLTVLLTLGLLVMIATSTSRNSILGDTTLHKIVAPHHLVLHQLLRHVGDGVLAMVGALLISPEGGDRAANGTDPPRHVSAEGTTR